MKPTKFPFLNVPLYAMALSLVMGITAGLGVAGCTHEDRKNAVDAAEVVKDIACAIENAELNDAEVAAVCNIADIVFDRIRPALSTHRRSLSRKGTKPSTCNDAGAR